MLMHQDQQFYFTRVVVFGRAGLEMAVPGLTKPPNQHIWPMRRLFPRRRAPARYGCAPRPRQRDRRRLLVISSRDLWPGTRVVIRRAPSRHLCAAWVGSGGAWIQPAALGIASCGTEEQALPRRRP